MPRFDMQDFLGLDDRDYRLIRIKWAIIHRINLMLEDVGIEPATLADAVDMDERHLEWWLRGMIRDVSVDSLALLYEAAAERAGWPSLETLIWGKLENGE